MKTESFITSHDESPSEEKYLQLGDKYNNQQKYRTAIAFYSKAIDINPCSVYAVLQRGKAYYCIQQYHKASKDCLRAISLNPTHSESLVLLHILTLPENSQKIPVSIRVYLDLIHDILTTTQNDDFTRWAKDILCQQTIPIETVCDYRTLTHSSGYRLIHIAAFINNLPLVAALLKASSPSEILTPETSVSPLHTATIAGHLSLISYLIEHAEQNIEQKTDTQKTPLHIAAMCGYTDITKYLIAKGANVNQLDSSEISPLHYAAAHKNFTIAECLIKNGANIQQLNNDGLTPASQAVYFGDLRLVKYLTTCKKDIIGQPLLKNGTTLLQIAAEYNHLNIVKYLIDQGADIRQADNQGNTPLIAAIKKGNIDIVKYLVVRSRTGNQLKQLFQKLMTPSYINQPNNAGMTPFYIAVGHGHLSIVKYLKEQGADIYQVDNEKNNPFFVALKLGHLEIVKYLVEQTDLAINNVTPLMVACYFGRVNIVKYLLETPDPRIYAICTGSKQTALHYAASKDHEDICKLLIMYGALLELKFPSAIPLLEVKNNVQKTALELTRSQEFQQFLQNCHQQRFLFANEFNVNKESKKNIYCNFFKTANKLPQPDCQIICADAPTHKR